MPGPLWVFDTSALIEIKSLPREKRPMVFATLSVLVKEGRLRKILDPRKDGGADEADPYVLALAQRIKLNGDDARIVTQETKDNPDKMSLNTAAGILGIASVPLAGFLHVEDTQ